MSNTNAIADSRRKVAFIIPDEEVYTTLSEYFSTAWNSQAYIHDTAGFSQATRDGRLDVESTDVVVSVDVEYTNPSSRQASDAYIQMLAYTSQAACVIILTTTDQQSFIQLAVQDMQKNHPDLEEKEIYFVPYNAAFSEIPRVVSFYDNHEQEIARERAILEESRSINVNTPKSTGEEVDTSRHGVVITSTSSKGGSGKSTVALLLATTIALSSKKGGVPLKTVIVDLDIFDSQLGFVIGTTRPNALTVAVSPDELNAELVARNLIYNERMGVHLLLAAPRSKLAYLTSPTFYAAVIEILKTMFDIVILDTSVQHVDDIIKSVALPKADLILLVSSLDIKSIHGSSRWLDEALTSREDGGHGLQKNSIGIVMNSSLNNVGIDKEMLEIMSRGVRRLVSIPMDSLAMLAAGNALRIEDIVLEHQEIGPAYFELAQKVIKPLGNPNIKLVPLIENGDDNGGSPARVNNPVATNNPAPAAAVQAKKSWFNRGKK